MGSKGIDLRTVNRMREQAGWAPVGHAAPSPKPTAPKVAPPSPIVIPAADGSEVIHFVVPTAAIGKPRMTRRDKWKKRPCVVAYRAWCDLVREHCPNPPPAERVEEITITARYVLPPSLSERERRERAFKRKRTKPDGDNIIKALCDALWKRDEALGDLSISRQWNTEDTMAVTIRVTPATGKAAT
jgi:Holliday junction resolvase RusA-like endonuclease